MIDCKEKLNTLKNKIKFILLNNHQRISKLSLVLMIKNRNYKSTNPVFANFKVLPFFFKGKLPGVPFHRVTSQYSKLKKFDFLR